MILSKEPKLILNTLLDKYERSATFRGENKVVQRFQLKPGELFPRYQDDAEYEFFVSLNGDLEALKELGFAELEKSRGRVGKVILNTQSAAEIYHAVGRKPKKDLLTELASFHDEQRKRLADLSEREDAWQDIIDALDAYLDEQQTRMKDGKIPEHFDRNLENYRDLWKCLLCLVTMDEEIFIRDLSVRLYQDSKRLEQLKGKISAILYKYGRFSEKEKVLEECGVIRNPSYVMIKGPAIIFFEDQQIDIGKLHGDLAFSSRTLSDVLNVQVYGCRLVTIENLTSFHRFEPKGDSVAVYLGGYHNKNRRELLKQIYKNNTDIAYFHFGDIDAGGFYIYEHLRKRTEIPFQLWKMDTDTLKEYIKFARKLTSNDIRRLKRIRGEYLSRDIQNPDSAKILETLDYMIEHEIKLEQEAIAEYWF